MEVLRRLQRLQRERMAAAGMAGMAGMAWGGGGGGSDQGEGSDLGLDLELDLDAKISDADSEELNTIGSGEPGSEEEAKALEMVMELLGKDTDTDTDNTELGQGGGAEYKEVDWVVLPDKHMCIIKPVKLSKAKRSDSEDECSICMEFMHGKNKIIKGGITILGCGHNFHVDCINEWLIGPIGTIGHSICPICKQEQTRYKKPDPCFRHTDKIFYSNFIYALGENNDIAVRGSRNKFICVAKSMLDNFDRRRYTTDRTVRQALNELYFDLWHFKRKLMKPLANFYKAVLRKEAYTVRALNGNAEAKLLIDQCAETVREFKSVFREKMEISDPFLRRCYNAENRNAKNWFLATALVCNFLPPDENTGLADNNIQLPESVESIFSRFCARAFKYDARREFFSCYRVKHQNDEYRSIVTHWKNKALQALKRSQSTDLESWDFVCTLKWLWYTEDDDESDPCILAYRELLKQQEEELTTRRDIVTFSGHVPLLPDGKLNRHISGVIVRDGCVIINKKVEFRDEISARKPFRLPPLRLPWGNSRTSVSGGTAFSPGAAAAALSALGLLAALAL
jgi:hypothetical protein